jgi:hypothetical protein
MASMFKYRSHFYFDNGLKIKVDFDLLRYYMWHLYRNVDSIGLNYPKHKAHISVILPRIHGKEAVEKSKKYAGQPVDLCYSGDIKQGGSWFKNYWLPVECDQAEQVKKELGVKENTIWRMLLHHLHIKHKPFLGYHATIASTKAFVVEQNPKARELSERMNKGEFTIDEFREKMKEL